MSDLSGSETSGVDTSAAEHVASKLGLNGDGETLEQMLSMPSVAFEVLSQSYRRHVVQYLIDNETPVDLRELARYVAARQRQTKPAAVTASERDEVAVRLVHVHIPKMVDFDLIEWMPEHGEVMLSTDDDITTPGGQDETPATELVGELEDQQDN